MKYCVLYNSKSGLNERGENPAQKLVDILTNDELDFCSMPDIKDFKKFFKEHRDPVIICGGDGTLNYFLNQIRDLKIKNQLWYYPCGSGNDFKTDIGVTGDKPILLTKYLKHLPTLTVNGKKYTVINGAGAGIDGYVCHEGNRLRKAGKQKVNYIAAGAKGILLAFHPPKVHLEVDGKSYDLENTWLISAMIGKYYGGGMMVAPMQDRLKSKKLAIIVATNPNRLRILILFPIMFKGQHLKYKDTVRVLYGNHIKVKLDEPTPLQYDGETFPAVSEYEIDF